MEMNGKCIVNLPMKRKGTIKLSFNDNNMTSCKGEVEVDMVFGFKQYIVFNCSGSVNQKSDKDFELIYNCSIEDGK